LKQNTEKSQYYQEDVVDLKEFFRVLIASRTLIISITAAFTILTGIYTFSKTPTYEATALVEIGSYTNNKNKNNITLVDSAPELVTKLNILFINLAKDQKNRVGSITSILTTKGVEGFIEINAEASSNEIATNEVNKVVKYIKTKHRAIIDNIKNRRASQIEAIGKQINLVKDKQIEILTKDNNLSDTEALIYSLQLIPIISGDLGVSSISQLFARRSQLTLLLEDYHYKNSEVVGRIMTNDYPIKPRKKIIVTTAFFVGFIFSIFLVFFMNVFKSKDD
jgi:LPS O-antigen subunit length determinant protein (WzzB/FepE family)